MFPEKDRGRFQGASAACSAAAFLFFASACAPSGGAADPVASAQKVEASSGERAYRAAEEIRDRNLSVIAAYSHQGGDVRLMEFGAAAADRIPAADTQIDINSITKTVTGVMAAKLVEQGKAAFDDRLDEIFDDVPGDKAGITLHHLLTHSSGLINSVGNDAEKLGREEFLARVFGSELKYAPGEKYRYSNVGYGVVAAIIEKRSGKPYEAFLREDVIAGLGLSNTGYMSVYDDARSLKTAEGKTILEASWGGHEPYWNLIGNGGLVSTVPEMIAFRQAVASGKIVSPEMLAIVQTPHIKEDEAGTSFYGYGLVVQDFEGIGRVYWHDGGNRVFSAQWGDYADQGDVLFTAGAGADGADAFRAMRILRTGLYVAE